MVPGIHVRDHHDPPPKQTPLRLMPASAGEWRAGFSMTITPAQASLESDLLLLPATFGFLTRITEWAKNDLQYQ